METKVIVAEIEPDSSALTDKQAEVLKFVCDRRTNKEIALLLGISPSAVEQRLQSVRRKFGVHSRADLARAYEKVQATSPNLTGAQYQVESSIPVRHSSIAELDRVFGPSDMDVLPDERLAQTGEIGSVGFNLKSDVLESFDKTAGVAGRVAAITTGAASMALLIILIARVAPALS